MSIPIFHAEKLEYNILYSIFDYLDKVAEQTQKVRFPAFIGLGSCAAVCLVTRTCSIAEQLINGLSLVFSRDQYDLGKNILSRVPVQFIESVVLPLGFIVNTFVIIRDPNFFILNNFEQVKVNVKHAEAGTFGSSEYERELQNAEGIAKNRLIERQERNENTHAN